MAKKNASSVLPFINLPKECYEEGITEKVIMSLLDDFPDYKSAMMQPYLVGHDVIYFDYDSDEERYYFLRNFGPKKNPRNTIRALIDPRHMEMAMAVGEREEVTKDLPPPPKARKKKSDEIL